MTTRNSDRERAAMIVVARWFRRSARPLPWREPRTTPWGVLLSEIMAQQTPVGRVAPMWIEWIERWPTPASLAAASPADIVRLNEQLHMVKQGNYKFIYIFVKQN
jgi:A/G-specific adenine glycosylase